MNKERNINNESQTCLGAVDLAIKELHIDYINLTVTSYAL